MPTEWLRTVSRWSRRTDRHRTQQDGVSLPSRRDEYTFFQAIVGAWPYGWDGQGEEREGFVQRTAAYMEKVIKEAKVETSWTRPNAAYEAAMRRFVEGSLRDDGFVADVAGFCDQLGLAGATNGLATTLLRLTAPGIPDTYQGSELWNQSYVDPDNRRPVDYAHRHAMLREIERGKRDPAALASALLDRWTDGAIKLYVTHAALETRARLRDVFLRGDYEPLATGEHLVGFVRGAAPGRRGVADGQVVVLVPRLPHRLAGGQRRWPTGDVWGDERVALPAGRFRDVFTGAVHQVVEDEPPRVATLLARLPVALLVREGGNPS
jgi:(1->4)-alpha-D-glucan 1-alpha-D-glucosylmutase